MPDHIACTSCTHTTTDLTAHYCTACWGPVTYHRSGPLLAPDPNQPGLWRYAPRLPDQIVIPGGWAPGRTPLISVPRLATELGVAQTWIKDETANPTHSFKDRVVALALARALYLGLDTVACTSTGNLGHSLAAASARLGLNCKVLVPASIEPEKIIAARSLGAQIISIDGSYDDVNRVAHQLADEVPWGWVNMTLRPYYAEGSKTLLWEILDQLEEPPTDIIAPAASGSLYSKLHAAAQAADPDSTIRFHAAQAAGCAPIARAFSAGTQHVEPLRPDSIAQSLAIGNPADGINALAAARRSQGHIVSVPEQDISAGALLLGRTTGVLTESAGAVTVQGARQLSASGVLGPESRLVMVITGDGLKATRLLDSSHARPLDTCPPDPDQVLALA